MITYYALYGIVFFLGSGETCIVTEIDRNQGIRSENFHFQGDLLYEGGEGVIFWGSSYPSAYHEVQPSQQLGVVAGEVAHYGYS